MLKRKSAASSLSSVSVWSTARQRRSPTTFSRILPPKYPRADARPDADHRRLSNLRPLNLLTRRVSGVQTYFCPEAHSDRNRLYFDLDPRRPFPGAAKRGPFWLQFGRMAMPAVSMTVNGKAVTG